MQNTEEAEAAKKMHEAYLQCKETFAPNRILINASVNIEDEEESLFFRTVSNFFIQQRQKEVIKNEKYRNL